MTSEAVTRYLNCLRLSCVVWLTQVRSSSNGSKANETLVEIFIFLALWIFLWDTNLSSEKHLLFVFYTSQLDFMSRTMSRNCHWKAFNAHAPHFPLKYFFTRIWMRIHARFHLYVVGLSLHVFLCYTGVTATPQHKNISRHGCPFLPALLPISGTGGGTDGRRDSFPKCCSILYSFFKKSDSKVCYFFL